MVMSPTGPSTAGAVSSALQLELTTSQTKKEALRSMINFYEECLNDPENPDLAESLSQIAKYFTKNLSASSSGKLEFDVSQHDWQIWTKYKKAMLDFQSVVAPKMRNKAIERYENLNNDFKGSVPWFLTDTPFIDLAKFVARLTSQPPVDVDTRYWYSIAPHVFTANESKRAISKIGSLHQEFQWATHGEHTTTELWLFVWRAMKQMWSLHKLNDYAYPYAVAATTSQLEEPFLQEHNRVFNRMNRSYEVLHHADATMLVSAFGSRCYKAFSKLQQQRFVTAGKLSERSKQCLHAFIHGEQNLNPEIVSVLRSAAAQHYARVFNKIEDADPVSSDSEYGRDTAPQEEANLFDMPTCIPRKSPHDYVWYDMPDTRAREVAASRQITRDMVEPGIVSEGMRTYDLVNIPPPHVQPPSKASPWKRFSPGLAPITFGLRLARYMFSGNKFSRPTPKHLPRITPRKFSTDISISPSRRSGASRRYDGSKRSGSAAEILAPVRDEMRRVSKPAAYSRIPKVKLRGGGPRQRDTSWEDYWNERQLTAIKEFARRIGVTNLTEEKADYLVAEYLIWSYWFLDGAEALWREHQTAEEDMRYESKTDSSFGRGTGLPPDEIRIVARTIAPLPQEVIDDTYMMTVIQNLFESEWRWEEAYRLLIMYTEYNQEDTELDHIEDQAELGGEDDGSVPSSVAPTVRIENLFEPFGISPLGSTTKQTRNSLSNQSHYSNESSNKENNAPPPSHRSRSSNEIQNNENASPPASNRSNHSDEGSNKEYLNDNANMHDGESTGMTSSSSSGGGSTGTSSSIRIISPQRSTSPIVDHLARVAARRRPDENADRNARALVPHGTQGGGLQDHIRDLESGSRRPSDWSGSLLQVSDAENRQPGMALTLASSLAQRCHPCPTYRGQYHHFCNEECVDSVSAVSESDRDPIDGPKDLPLRPEDGVTDLGSLVARDVRAVLHGRDSRVDLGEAQLYARLRRVFNTTDAYLERIASPLHINFPRWASFVPPTDSERINGPQYDDFLKLWSVSVREVGQADATETAVVGLVAYLENLRDLFHNRPSVSQENRVDSNRLWNVERPRTFVGYHDQANNLRNCLRNIGDLFMEIDGLSSRTSSRLSHQDIHDSYRLAHDKLLIVRRGLGKRILPQEYQAAPEWAEYGAQGMSPDIRAYALIQAAVTQMDDTIRFFESGDTSVVANVDMVEATLRSLKGVLYPSDSDVDGEEPLRTKTQQTQTEVQAVVDLTQESPTRRARTPSTPRRRNGRGKKRAATIDLTSPKPSKKTATIDLTRPGPSKPTRGRSSTTSARRSRSRSTQEGTGDETVPTQKATAPALPTEADYMKMLKEELVVEAEYRGLDVTGSKSMKKKDFADALVASDQEGVTGMGVMYSWHKMNEDEELLPKRPTMSTWPTREAVREKIGDRLV
ncbi:uncharacterized protein HMPREF1541_06815 [Cyphellophora europaea CBS 101466]|uniref:Uncharacterized protein n=1 Tax=Cyphellophora europaea (strain CBS 101466) TaxID=1220924 RepID=W2RQN8_CYPE1|nr:uncharacterized protein HMPREF1541_06815 [Cyphellophora europaea CBS 101466]ETN38777.1 hypothetical protein HMPREF1541_06815 [Cyphellophora europaea CBS 101466]